MPVCPSNTSLAALEAYSNRIGFGRAARKECLFGEAVKDWVASAALVLFLPFVSTANALTHFGLSTGFANLLMVLSATQFQLASVSAA